MNIPFLLADYIKGKKIFPTIRRILNLLFLISISSFIFEKIYFSYSWPDITDYKLFLDFFVKGYFIVPFSIFILVASITYFIPTAILSFLYYKYSTEIQKKILQYEIETEKLPAFVTSKQLVEAYPTIRNSLSAEVIKTIEQNCSSGKLNVESNMIFCTRTILCLCVYFSIIPYFGYLLFGFTLVILLCAFILQLVAYGFFEFLPVALQKFKYEMDKYIQQHVTEFKEQ